MKRLLLPLVLVNSILSVLTGVSIWLTWGEQRSSEKTKQSPGPMIPLGAQIPPKVLLPVVAAPVVREFVGPPFDGIWERDLAKSLDYLQYRDKPGSSEYQQRQGTKIRWNFVIQRLTGEGVQVRSQQRLQTPVFVLFLKGKEIPKDYTPGGAEWNLERAGQIAGQFFTSEPLNNTIVTLIGLAGRYPRNVFRASDFISSEDVLSLKQGDILSIEGAWQDYAVFREQGWLLLLECKLVAIERDGKPFVDIKIKKEGIEP